MEHQDYSIGREGRGREGRGEEREGEREGGRKGRREKGREGEREGGKGGRREREGEYTHTLQKQEECKGGRGREGTLFPGHTFLVSNTNSFPLRVATFPNESLGEKRIG